MFVKLSRRFLYPDISIVCGEPFTDPAAPGKESVSNPIVIIEVLLPSTANDDRTKKFGFYMGLESLREYVLVYADQPRVETFLRQDDGTWSFAFAEDTEAGIKLRSLDVTLPFKELYVGVTFQPVPEPIDPRLLTDA